MPLQDLDQWRRAANAKLDSLEAQIDDLQRSLASQRHGLQRKLQELSEMMQSQHHSQQQAHIAALQQKPCKT